ncbi:MAG: hypothetical protein WDO14_20610 [Bacteroidota bacterium]
MSALAVSGLNPGLSGAIEKDLLSNDRYALLVTGKTGFYIHRYNNTGIFFAAQSGVRYRIAGKFYLENYVGVGYLHTFLNGGKAYIVDAAGTVKRYHDYGSGHFMPSISPGISYEVGDLRFFARTMIFWQIPFNRVSLVQYSLETGLSFKLQFFCAHP